MSTWIRPLVCVEIRRRRKKKKKEKKPLLLPRYQQVLTVNEGCGVVHLLVDALCAHKHPRSILNKSPDTQTYPKVCQRITKEWNIISMHEPFWRVWCLKCKTMRLHKHVWFNVRDNKWLHNEQNKWPLNCLLLGSHL